MGDGINSEIQSRNLILQIMGEDGFNEKYRNNLRENLSFSLDDLVGEENKKNNFGPKEVTDEIKDLMGKKGKAFLHTKEYYAAIEEEQERMKAYHGVEVSSVVLSGEEAEIKENPFKFLNISEDATFGQTRVAWIRLSKSWFPDLMYPENPEQYKSKSQAIEEIDLYQKMTLYKMRSLFECKETKHDMVI